MVPLRRHSRVHTLDSNSKMHDEDSALVLRKEAVVIAFLPY